MIQRLRALWAGSFGVWARLSLTVLCALACAVGGVALWEQRRSSAERSTSPLVDPLANLNHLGVHADLTQYSADELASVLSRIEDAGLVWVRQRFGWEQIEPQPGETDWSSWDAIVQACDDHDLNLIAVLDGAPAWARAEDARSPWTPPREVSDWGSFVSRLAGRYQGQIAAYQLWNEPNLAEHWGGRYVDPVAYTWLLREGAIRVRQADPGAVVLLAALAPTVETGPLNLNEADYLRGIANAGGAPYFDAISLQPYGFGEPADAAPSAGALNYRRVEHVRRELVRLGLAERPVWATAWGWNHLPAGIEPASSPWPSVTSEQQVGYTMDALLLARRDWPWMGPMILYTLQPDVPSDDPRWGFALLDPQGMPTALFDRLAEYRSAQVPLRTGVYVPAEDNANVTGGWRFSPAGADPPVGADVDQRNAILSFDVRAANLDLTVRRGDFWGVFYVSIDGGPANGLPRDEQGRSYLVLHDPAGQTEQVPVARGLDARGPHHVEIVAHGGWGQWPLVSWTVHESPVSPPDPFSMWSFAALAVVAAVAAGVQIATQPLLHRTIYGAIGRTFRWYRALPEWIPVLLTASVALGFYWVPWTLAALPLLAILVLLVFLRIDLGLALVAFSLPFYLRPKVLLGRPFSIVELGLAVCLVAWLVARLLDLGRSLQRNAGQPLQWRLQQFDRSLREWPVRLWRSWTWLDKGVVLLLLVAVVSLNWTAHQDVAQRELRTVFLESALFYALIRLAVRSPRAHQRLIEGWLLGAVVISCLGIGQLVAGQNLITAEGVWRVRGLYGSPNNLALYLERALPVLLAVAWQGRQQVSRWLYGLAALPVLAALVMTLSKGALLIGLPAALLAMGLAQRRRKATWFAVGAVVVVALLVLPFAFTERFRSVLNLSTGTAFFRLKLWRATLSMIADHPFTGVGMDNFLYSYRSRYVLPSAWGELDLSHPHNLILDTWTRLGLPGLAAVGWLLFAFLRIAWRQFQAATGDQRALLLGLGAAMVAALAHGLVDHALFLIDLSFVFALMAALVQRDK